MSLDVSAFPRCAKRLEWNFTQMSDPLMNEYWAAVIVADFCDDDAMEAFGGFNFDDRSPENGRQLLARLEACIAQKKHKTPKEALPSGLVSALGARGVKTSMLKPDDFWTTAEILFPGRIERKGDLSSLYQQIRSIPKKDRKALATANLRNLPGQWLSDAPVHARKLH